MLAKTEVRVRSGTLFKNGKYGCTCRKFGARPDVFIGKQYKCMENIKVSSVFCKHEEMCVNVKFIAVWKCVAPSGTFVEKLADTIE